VSDPIRVAGLISGTSLDAIDVAVVDIRSAEPGALELSLITAGEEPWPPSLRARIAGWVADPAAAVPLGDLAATDMEVGAALADALLVVLRGAGIDPVSLDLVASHGQTVHHRVDAGGTAIASLQIGQPAVIAERLGCTVVADFRPRDVAAGGQGAPLVALFDALVFADPDRDVAVLNLGGIANVTVIPSGRPERAMAWDTGPANGILDALARMNGLDRDTGGMRAAAGSVDEATVAELLDDPWFARRPPKSTGRERFGDAYAAALAGRAMATDDGFATATALTARSVARALRDHAVAWPSRVWVGGGGTANPTLMRALGDALREATPTGASAPELVGVDAAGIPFGSKEAIAFAFLGHETLHGRPSSLVGATGARHPSVLGAIWPAGQRARRPAIEDASPDGPVRRLRIRGDASHRTGVDGS
jgi:anhydro-N-acetylmuramic acid kinase